MPAEQEPFMIRLQIQKNRSKETKPRHARHWAWWTAALGALGIISLVIAPIAKQSIAEPLATEQISTVKLPSQPLTASPLDAARAMGYLNQICAIGPRISGTTEMQTQQALLQQHFTALGGQVEMQRFRLSKHPIHGRPVPMANLIVHWHPERKKRILLCAHYDTRPMPDRDPNPYLRRSGVFLGANDGASGVALLMELAHFMPKLESNYGIDFALFDAEELVYVDNRDPYFLGSSWFARQVKKNRSKPRYRWAVLFDMVADADLQIYQERYSTLWKDTRPLVKEIWATAQQIGVKEFIARTKHEVRDDHLPLHRIAKIPTCDIIDFDYTAWHTTADTPRRCSGESLAKVGWVVLEWLKKTK